MTMDIEPGTGARTTDDEEVIDVDRGETTDTSEEPSGLLQEQDGEAFRARWAEIQVGFVDEPRESVERADQLVAELMQQLTTMFDEERRSLESRWDSGDDVSTEDLRMVLQRYRSFFGRLLAA